MDPAGYELRDRGTGGKNGFDTVTQQSAAGISGSHVRDGVVMAHLGKKQQFNVRAFLSSVADQLLVWWTDKLYLEKFWLPYHPCPIIHAPVFVGSCFWVGSEPRRQNDLR